MRPNTKISVTLTYQEWIDVLRGLAHSFNPIDTSGWRNSERALFHGDSRAVHEKITKRLVERRAKGR